MIQVSNIRPDYHAPPSKNVTSIYLERFLKELADDQYSSIIKSSIYSIKHMYIQYSTTAVDYPEIGGLMEVSMLYLQILRFYLVGQ